MRFDPRDRLRRRLPGASVDPDAHVLDGLFAREEPPDRPDPVPPRDQKQLPTLSFRRASRLADPRPNAPLLIRLVRHPYGLSPDRPRRKVWLERTEPFVRVPVGEEIAAALAERKGMRFTSAAGRKRPTPFAVRPSEWVLLPPEPGEDR